LQEHQIAEQLRAEEEKTGKQALIQNIGNALIEVKKKPDKLVNGFLEGIIERDAYLKKKEELIIKKGDLESQSKQFGDKALVWVEPMMKWLEAAHNAGDISKSENYEEIKLFVEKIGSNRLLQDKKVEIKWNEPYLILSKYNVLGDKLETKNKKEADSKKEGLPLMWSWRELNPRPNKQLKCFLHA